MVGCTDICNDRVALLLKIRFDRERMKQIENEKKEGERKQEWKKDGVSKREKKDWQKNYMP